MLYPLQSCLPSQRHAGNVKLKEQTLTYKRLGVERSMATLCIIGDRMQKSGETIS